MVRSFIEKPVLSTVISIIIVILGILGIMKLPVTQFPEIAPPSVVVSASYNGASADVVAKSVLIPLEEVINGVDGMSYITSTASNDGSGTITVFFNLGTDPDMAAVNVQNRVSKALGNLPKEVIETGVTTQKQQSSMLLMISVYSEDPAYDETFLQNFVKINIVPELQRVDGVGSVSVFGVKDYSMRVWLLPDRMASYGLNPADITAAISEQNFEAAPGKLGTDDGKAFEYIIKYKGKLDRVSEFQEIVIKMLDNGQILRLKDVARIELGAFNYGFSAKAMGYDGVGMAVYQTSGSNAKQIITLIEEKLKQQSEGFPKGIKYNIPYNTKEFLDASIEHVLHTLFEAFLLVFIVVFIFLQDFRSTLIPAIAVPVAIVGTFFFLDALGFTINILTLFALVLAIGIVVDDAIVVVEAVHSKLEKGNATPKQATISAMSEITGAIISITLIMSAVFIPVAFLPGSAGVFYRQFALTLAIAIVLSAINALTLSPALCSVFLKPHAAGHSKKGIAGKFFAGFNSNFDKLTEKYGNAVKFFSKRKWVSIAVVFLFAGGTYLLLKNIQTGFIPTEDTGVIFADVSLPPNATRERTEKVLEAVDKAAQSLDLIQERLYIAGTSLIAGVNAGAYGLMVFKLKPWDERKNKGQSVEDVVGELYKLTANIRDGNVIFFVPPTVSGFGSSDGFELRIKDNTGGPVTNLDKVSQDLVAALSERDELAFAVTSFSTNFPQYMIEVDIAKCKQTGVDVNSLFATLQGYIGGAFSSDFNKFGKQYRIILQADADYRKDESSLAGIFTKNNAGEMVPVSGLVRLKKVYGPESISRYNLSNSVTINGKAKEGYGTGDAIKAVEEVASANLPAGFTYEWTGITRDEISSAGQAPLIFALVIVFVYLLLSAQYESYILPYAVLLSLPVGIFGAFLFIKLFDIDNNIYFQVALIMLIGLLAKNAILIVEFAVQRRKSGMSIVEAGIAGAIARLRPILMTSFAFIFGLIPLVIAKGAGAIGNRSIGTGAVGGMLVGTLVGALFIPVFFMIFQALQERFSGLPEEKENPAEQNVVPEAE